MSDADALAASLTEHGLKHAFGVVGSGASLRVAEGLTARGADFHVVGHEAAGVLMAAGAWRATGLASLAVTIKGPGLANAVPGLAHCWFDQQPCLLATEAYGPNDDPLRLHKRMSADATAAFVRARFGLSAHAAEGAIDAAMRQPRGPVQIDLVSDLGSSSTSPVATDGASRITGGTAVLDRIAASQRPVLLLGALSLDRPWAALAANLRIPVFTTVAAKGAIDERLPPSAGILTGAGGPASPEAVILGRTDLVVAVGVRGEELLVGQLHVPTVYVDEVPPTVATAHTHVVATAGAALWRELLDALAGFQWGIDEAQAAQAALCAQFDRERWWPGTPLAAIDSLAGDHSLVVDTGSFCTVAEHRWAARPGRRFTASANGRYMGVAIPLAIGEAVAARKPTICVVGDGGIRSYPGELKLAVAERLPLLVVLVRDGVYSSVSQARGVRPSACLPAVLPEPSWHGVMEALGLASRVVSTPEDLASALGAWTGDRPGFIECVFDPDWDAAPLAGVR